MKWTYTTLFSLLSFLSIQAQEECGTMHYHKEALANDPTYKKVIELNERSIQQKIAEYKSNPTRSETVYQIPIVFHVVHLGEAEGVGTNISDAQIQSGIDQLNDAFRNVDGNGVDVGIEFVLATQDPNCDPTTGINRVDGRVVSGYESAGINHGTAGADQVEIKALSKWPNSDYYNIWIVSEIDDNNGGNGVQGYAYYPGAGSDVDGTVIMNTAIGNIGTANSWNNQGKTLIHEMGHAFNLYHVFEGDNDGNNCPAGGCGSGLGDCCDDTEILIRSSGCPSGINACTGVDYAGTQNNYMDYSNQDCRIQFTPDQKDRMRAALEELRPSLITSRGLSSNTGYTTPSNASCTPTTSATGLSGGYSGIMNFTFNGISFPSSNAENDGGYVDYTDQCLKLLEVEKGMTYNFSTVVWINTHYLKVWIDYNDDGAFDDNTELILNTTVPAYDTANATVTIPNNATVNTTLRMRAMVDLQSEFPNACHNPTYGQAEDFPIMVVAPTNAPTAAFSASATEACIGSDITFTDESTNSPTSWEWNISGPELMSSFNASPTFTFDMAGSYEVALTVANNDGEDETVISNYITINDLPNVYYPNSNSDSVLITSGIQLVAMGTPSGGSFSGAGIVNDITFDPEIAGLGNHEITYTYEDPSTGCVNSTIYTYIVYDELTSLMNDDIHFEYAYFTEDQFNFKTVNPLNHISVYQMNGQLIEEIQINQAQGAIQLQEMPSGIYLIRITNNLGKTSSIKRIKL